MTKHSNDLDTLFSALSDPTRRAILTRLARGPATLSELHNPHDMALPSLMAHVKKLETAGLISTEKRGRIRTCRLTPGAFTPVQSWLEQQRSLWTGRLDRFDAYVTQLTQSAKEHTDDPRSKD
ncbi:ArsR/SmtB family transcription factor [Celeribacter baekdonensis]|uniref:ArsR family transcriptional regulator n=2 Tax=Roseobacteraceae TaxID=2854170 RepID=K2JFG6_9RHOB|nr:metalloregulator ArsR/SmtB family transcription factor [Celeribacter baekdonensis]EKE73352.1 ArsR family transcriptional regulator [Celeribacter baekdonensis B30]|tara:strand:- start:49574 stop:49942 length:369 start_codon:yes stop_codon:yes gene_type:complete